MNSVDSQQVYEPAREMGPPFPPQPIEIEMNSARILPSPSASASTAWDSALFGPHGLGEMPTYVTPSIPRHPQMDNQVRTANQDPLFNWYTGNDGPWIPKGISEVVSDERESRIRVGNRMPLQYGTHYRRAAPSDAGSYAFGTLPSDSGYGSNGARKSDGNASIFSADVTERDHGDHDLLSLPGPGADFQPYQGVSEAMQNRDTHHNKQWAASSISSSNGNSKASLTCPTCKKSVKTQSELKYYDDVCLIDLS